MRSDQWQERAWPALEIVDVFDAGRERARMARGMRGAKTVPGVELTLALGDDVSTKVVVRLRKLHQCKRAQTATNVHGESLQRVKAQGDVLDTVTGAKLDKATVQHHVNTLCAAPSRHRRDFEAIFTSPLKKKMNRNRQRRCGGRIESSSTPRIGTNAPSALSRVPCVCWGSVRAGRVSFRITGAEPRFESVRVVSRRLRSTWFFSCGAGLCCIITGEESGSAFEVHPETIGGSAAGPEARRSASS